MQLIAFLLLQSESNVQHVLVSDPKDGVSSYGLTDRGKQQATEVPVKSFLYKYRIYAPIFVYIHLAVYNCV